MCIKDGPKPLVVQPNVAGKAPGLSSLKNKTSRPTDFKSILKQ